VEIWFGVGPRVENGGRRDSKEDDYYTPLGSRGWWMHVLGGDWFLGPNRTPYFWSSKWRWGYENKVVDVLYVPHLDSSEPGTIGGEVYYIRRTDALKRTSVCIYISRKHSAEFDTDGRHKYQDLCKHVTTLHEQGKESLSHDSSTVHDPASHPCQVSYIFVTQLRLVMPSREVCKASILIPHSPILSTYPTVIGMILA
jgi:hypothetical protein